MVIKLDPCAVLSVRQSVLRIGLPLESCVFEGDNEPNTQHFGFVVGQRIVGVVTLMKKGHHQLNHQNSFQLRGMAVLDAFRGQNIGNALLKQCEIAVASFEKSLIWMNARKGALDFYSKFQYEVVGFGFEIDQIGTHFLMKKEFYR
ncbi:hypothetical protein B0A58_05735 [Flavobacterium branchiophilum NBRC 15030 = ATCC 35035]|uniref:Acetyltransferase (GNAT) family protein n=1 Tax=Flavobacterium branchiophilum TaxID=55197 RepID=A0A543G1R9_9FLAO|nr:GNAT family N-acetyltransferase [Flavobacterium branchiophilum]OXA77381.1 hypothetical protein B0A58_05735 [Flavobacterium branchiophilum NBRC 15030 = ATCC 35035]TQM40021.1 acetyltransferase (GNAT) family protein [Flavobacterium branchiophilum]GEM56566.1 hypothetical protein FB1_27870 [Flavobacterium branchiophilum NBRC 15030 = ATCC 35035]